MNVTEIQSALRQLRLGGMAAVLEYVPTGEAHWSA